MSEVKLCHWLLIAILFWFLLICLTGLSWVGLNYDECIFVNTALGWPEETFIYRKIFSLPYQFVPYSGALKGYVFMPFFKLWGPSLFTVRLPAILIGFLVLILTYRILLSYFTSQVALISVALLALDASFVFSIRHDWGPIALMSLLKMLVLWSIAHMQVRRTISSAWLICLVSLLLGLFDKLNFAWFIIGLALALSVYWQTWWTMLQQTSVRLRLTMILAALSSALWFADLARDVLKPQFLADGDLGFGHRWTTLIGTLTGDIVFFQLSDRHLPLASLLIWVLIPAVAFTVYGFFKRSGPDHNSALYFLLWGLVVTVLFLMTSRAKGPHHVMMCYPVPHVLVAFLITKLRRKLGLIFGLMLMLSMAGTQLQYLYFFQQQQLRQTWHPAQYDLFRQLNSLPSGIVIPCDWGFQTQSLVLLDRNKHQIREPEYWRDRHRDLEGFTDLLKQNQPLYFISHGPEFQQFKSEDQAFRQYIGQLGYRLTRIADLPDGEGQLRFSIDQLEINRHQQKELP